MFHLDQVVPWGRDLSEYSEMFDISGEGWPRKVLGCGDGPASFNAELVSSGRSVHSCDPLYLFSRNQIRQRLESVRPEILSQVRENRDEFVWTRFRDESHLEKVRLRAMDLFLEDYDKGRKDGRYLPAALPHLPFASGTFDLAVCSHFLFLYSEQLDEQFHYAAIRELLRCAHEIRIFPVLQLGAKPSPHLQPLVAALRKDGFVPELLETTYEFQRGGRDCLRVSRRTPAP